MQPLDTAITELAMTFRTRRILNEIGVRCVGDLLKFTEDSLSRIYGFGAMSMAEVKSILRDSHVDLPLDPPDDYEEPVTLSRDAKTQKYIAALQKGWSEGKTVKEIAAEAFVMTQRLYDIIRQYHLQPPTVADKPRPRKLTQERNAADKPRPSRLTQERIAALKAGWAQGKQIVEIAEELDISRHTVNYIIVKYRLQPPRDESGQRTDLPRKIQPRAAGMTPTARKCLDALRAGVARGDSVRSIASECGVTRAYLYLLIKQYGIDYPTRVCEGCGKEFTPQSPGQYECPKCEPRYRPRSPDSNHAEHSARYDARKRDHFLNSKTSEAMKKRWADPDYRRRMSEAMRARNQTEQRNSAPPDSSP